MAAFEFTLDQFGHDVVALRRVMLDAEDGVEAARFNHRLQRLGEVVGNEAGLAGTAEHGMDVAKRFRLVSTIGLPDAATILREHEDRHAEPGEPRHQQAGDRGPAAGRRGLYLVVIPAAADRETLYDLVCKHRL